MCNGFWAESPSSPWLCERGETNQYRVDHRINLSRFSARNSLKLTNSTQGETRQKEPRVRFTFSSETRTKSKTTGEAGNLVPALTLLQSHEVH